jgi:hypothetical protein
MQVQQWQLGFDYKKCVCRRRRFGYHVLDRESSEFLESCWLLVPWDHWKMQRCPNPRQRCRGVPRTRVDLVEVGRSAKTRKISKPPAWGRSRGIETRHFIPMVKRSALQLRWLRVFDVLVLVPSTHMEIRRNSNLFDVVLFQWSDGKYLCKYDQNIDTSLFLGMSTWSCDLKLVLKWPWHFVFIFRPIPSSNHPPLSCDTLQPSASVLSKSSDFIFPFPRGQNTLHMCDFSTFQTDITCLTCLHLTCSQSVRFSIPRNRRWIMSQSVPSLQDTLHPLQVQSQVTNVPAYVVRVANEYSSLLAICIRPSHFSKPPVASHRPETWRNLIPADAHHIDATPTCNWHCWSPPTLGSGLTNSVPTHPCGREA